MSAKVEKCLKCNDQGWRPVKSSSGGVLFERCFCRAGKARAAKEYQEAMKKINADPCGRSSAQGMVETNLEDNT